MNQPLVLIVEDDPQVRRMLRASLPGAGYALIEAATAAEALSLAPQHVPDLILLDLGLPDLDGVEVIHRLRAWTAIPIVVVSARELERQKVAALDAGADDYVTKPFGFPELLARMRVALRHAAAREARAAATTFTVGPLSVDLEARVVRLGDDEVHLTPIEYKLLAVLVRHAGRVVTHQRLLEAVWGPRSAHQTPYLRVHLMNVRRKLAAGGRLLVTEPGVGYRLVDE